MRKLLRILLALLALIGLAVFAIALARARVGLVGPHTTTRTAARLDPALDAAMKFQIEAEKPQTTEEVISFALKRTGAHLRFGLGHPTRYAFSADERRANCIEYSHLFARIFDMAATRAKLSAKAYVVHSARAEVYGRVIPLPGFHDHDWVLVVDESDGQNRQWFVDPTFDDMWLGWELTHNVQGTVKAYK